MTRLNSRAQWNSRGTGFFMLVSGLTSVVLLVTAVLVIRVDSAVGDRPLQGSTAMQTTGQATTAPLPR